MGFSARCDPVGFAADIGLFEVMEVFRDLEHCALFVTGELYLFGAGVRDFENILGRIGMDQRSRAFELRSVVFAPADLDE